MLKNTCKLLFVGLISILFVLGAFVTSGLALEGKAGEVIKSVKDIKELQAKGLLTEYQVIPFSELIEDFGVSIRIVETTDRSPEVAVSKTYRKFTNMNKGKAGIGPEGELVNYAGQGLPFPDVTPDDPQAGNKAAWNFDYKHSGDDWTFVTWTAHLTSAKGYVRSFTGETHQLHYNCRTDIAPIPRLFPDRHGDTWFKERIRFFAPFASKGLAQLVVKYMDPKRERDVWVYVPGLRRNTRVGAGNRCDCLGGFLPNLDDSMCWAGDTSNFDWKLLGVKEHLVDTLIAGRDWENVKTGKIYLRGAHHLPPTLERRKVWVIEQTPKFKGYCYSKRIYYYDPDSRWFLYQEMYDRVGKVWKTLVTSFRIFPNPEETGGGGVLAFVCGTTVDFRIWEAQPFITPDEIINKGLPDEMFTLSAMRQAGR